MIKEELKHLILLRDNARGRYHHLQIAVQHLDPLSIAYWPTVDLRDEAKRELDELEEKVNSSS
jgi:hypothetical protein